MIGLQNAGKTSLLRVLAVSALATYWPRTRSVLVAALLNSSLRAESLRWSMHSFSHAKKFPGDMAELAQCFSGDSIAGAVRAAAILLTILTSIE